MQSRPRWLFGILLLAFVLRLVAAMTLQWRLDHVWKRQFLIDGDARGYLLLAERITKGESYEIYTPPRQVLRMPGFPAFLALVMSVWSSGMLPLRFALCGVGTVACGLVYWLGRELVDVDTGLTAAALTAVSPVMVGFTPLILSETMFAATLVASLIPLARLFQRHIAARGTVLEKETTPVVGSCLAVTAGVLIGVACYVRPSWLLAAPMYAALLVVVSGQRRRALLHGALLLAGLFVCLLPWGIRNQRVTGHFVLTTLWAGPSLYDGLHPGATGESDMTFFDRDNLLSKMSEYDVDRHYRDAAWQFVRKNPGRAIELGFIKLWRFWKPWPGAEQFNHWTAKAVVAIWFIPLVIFSVLGASRLRRNGPALLLCVGPILYFSALHTVFVSSLRYRLPAEYPLAVIAAAGVLACLSRRGSPLARSASEG
jgi:4-amino-4-deoxy-L-arabinose transferase-like glycosyltransferase